MPKRDAQADFGPATIKHLNLYKQESLYVYEHESQFYEFSKVSCYKNGTIRVRCVGCHNLQMRLKRKGDVDWREMQPARTSVLNGRFVRDHPAQPERTGGHRHICDHGQRKPAVISKQGYREKCASLKDNPEPPNKAHRAVANNIRDRLDGDVDAVREALDYLEHLKFHKRTYERNRRAGLHPIDDFKTNRMIPESLLVLKEFRTNGPAVYHDRVDGNPFHKRLVVWFERDTARKPFVVISSPEMLEAYADADTVGFDGTFDSAADDFYQLYVGAKIREEYEDMDGSTVCTRSEGLPLFLAHMPDKTTESYVKLFDVVRSAAASIKKRAKFDYEVAAIKAYKQVNPEDDVRSCTWHFGQDSTHWINRNGCTVPFRTNPLFRDHVRQYLGLPMLPVQYINQAIDHLNDNLPVGMNADDTRDLQKYIRYFDRFWRGKQNIWSLFGIRAPRTNNALEGLNNKISTMFDRAVHPELAWSLHVFQSEIMLIDSRLRAIKAGGEHARPFKRAANDIVVEKSIVDEERRFYRLCRANNMAPSIHDIMAYLRSQSYNLGTASEKTRRERRLANAAVAVAQQANDVTVNESNGGDVGGAAAGAAPLTPNQNASNGSGLPSAGPDGSCTTVDLFAQTMSSTVASSMPGVPIAQSTPTQQTSSMASTSLELYSHDALHSEIQYLQPVTMNAPIDDLDNRNDSLDDLFG